MIYVVNDSNDPYFNHAAEEYLMKNFDDEVFILWVNKPAILIGKNQNTLSEIQLDYVKENNIEVVRRLSGGGTVYNDLGNMNFTFITYRDSDPTKDGFEKFASPVIEALQSLEVDARFTGRNDILIEGKKFSGNAQYCSNKKILHHGTIMFNCDMSKLSYALKSRDIKFVDKSVKSVGSRVTNIYPHLKEPMSVEEFRTYLKNFVIDYHNIKNVYEFTQKDIDAIETIADERFRTWDWNYGKSPRYRYENLLKFPGVGVVEYSLDIDKGLIKNISIYGDFFGEEDISNLEGYLLGTKFNIESLTNKLAKINLSKYIRGLSVENFVKGIMDINI